MNKQRETFSFNPPINLVEERKWLLAVTNFRTTILVFNITSGNKSFPIRTPGHWNSEDGDELISKLNKLLELRSEEYIELHVREIGKRGTRTETENSGHNLAGFEHLQSEILAKLKKSKR